MRKAHLHDSKFYAQLDLKTLLYLDESRIRREIAMYSCFVHPLNEVRGIVVFIRNAKSYDSVTH